MEMARQLARLMLLVLMLAACTVVQGGVRQCARSNTQARSLVAGPNHPLDPLSKHEAQQVSSFLTGLKLNGGTTVFSNRVVGLDLFYPPKDATIAFLEGKGGKPPRYAKAIVHRGALAVPDVMVYKVGPLPITSASTATPTIPDNAMPFFTRYPDAPEYDGWQPLIDDAMRVLTPLCVESFSGLHYDPDNDAASGLIATDIQLLRRDRLRYSTVFWMPKIPGSWIVPLPLTFMVNSSSIDPAGYHLFGFTYNGQGFFDTAQSLMDAYTSGRLTKVTMNLSKKEKGWSSLKKTAQTYPRVGADKAKPLLYEPEGSRFIVHSNNTLEWMGWSVHVGFSYETGPRLDDIRFMGQRIIYEMSLQDAYSSYSGFSPVPSATIYLDSSSGLGGGAKSLKPGVDCPPTATFLDGGFWDADDNGNKGAWTDMKQMICIFEDDGLGNTIWRHWDGDLNFYGGLREQQLVVRWVLKEGNYDYMVDVRMHVGGGIEMNVGPTGYLQPTFALAGDPDKNFGFRVGTYTWSSLHDHQIGVKVDVDVLGTSNSFYKYDVQVGTPDQALGVPLNQVPDWIEPTQTMKYVVSSRVESENEARLRVNPSKPSNWVFMNENQVNRHGTTRGYQLSLKMTGTQILPDSDSAVFRAAAYTKQNLAVTRRKEEEEHCMPIWDTFTANTFVSLDDYIDGESLVGEDLVAWVAMSGMHLPRAEDAPMTEMKFLGFCLHPFNYFDGTPSMDLGPDSYFQVGSNGAISMFQEYTNPEPCVPRDIPQGSQAFSDLV